MKVLHEEQLKQSDNQLLVSSEQHNMNNIKKKAFEEQIEHQQKVHQEQLLMNQEQSENQVILAIEQLNKSHAEQLKECDERFNKMLEQHRWTRLIERDCSYQVKNISLFEQN